jgi:hypothetical protein
MAWILIHVRLIEIPTDVIKAGIKRLKEALMKK